MLKRGGLVALPTETVYGLAADASNGNAVARIFEAKGRPRFNPLIAHVADFEMAQRLAIFDPLSQRLAAAFWPGPLTLVLPLLPGAPVHDLVTAGLDTIAIRMPKGFAWGLIAPLGRPLAAPRASAPLPQKPLPRILATRSISLSMAGKRLSALNLQSSRFRQDAYFYCARAEPLQTISSMLRVPNLAATFPARLKRRACCCRIMRQTPA